MELGDRRRGVLASAALVALVAVAAGCGTGGPDVQARRAPRQEISTTAVAGDQSGAEESPAGPGAGTQLVRYRGIEFTVPADWPVYDLEADSSVCVRFDVHAVYLGSPGADMRCPAQLLGRTAAVLVEPVGTVAERNGVDAELNGLSVTTDPRAEVEHQVRAVFHDVGLAVTISLPATPTDGSDDVAAASQGDALSALSSLGFRAASP